MSADVQEKSHRQLVELLQGLRVALRGGATVVRFTVATAAVFIALWFAIPMLMRMTGGSDPTDRKKK